MKQITLNTSFKNKEWPSPKKKVKQIRYLRKYLAIHSNTPILQVKLSKGINEKFHSMKSLGRRELNKIRIVKTEGVFKLVGEE